MRLRSWKVFLPFSFGGSERSPSPVYVLLLTVNKVRNFESMQSASGAMQAAALTKSISLEAGSIGVTCGPCYVWVQAKAQIHCINFLLGSRSSI